MNKLVSIQVPILNAIKDMGLDTVRDVPTLTRWAADAEKEIGSYYSFSRKIDVIKVKNCCAAIPCDAAFIQYVLLGDYGCDCSDLFKRWSTTAINIAASTTDTFLVVDGAGENNDLILGGIKWEAQAGNIVFDRNFDGEYVTVQYLGMNKDEEGFPLIGENHIEAIVTYIQYKYAIRSRFSPTKMDHNDVRHFWKEWMRLASSARGEDGQLSDSDRQEIVAMIHDPFVGYGLEAGMTNKFDY